MTELRNRINKNELKVRLAQEQIERVTFSFYKSICKLLKSIYLDEKYI